MDPSLGFAGGTWRMRSPTRETPMGVGLGSPPALGGAQTGHCQTPGKCL